MKKRPVLRFGIQSLDRLIGSVTARSSTETLYGIDLKDPRSDEEKNSEEPFMPVTASICLAGPDGTGKSVLSLHLAAQYLADCMADSIEADKPIPEDLKVLYISTDLSYNMAFKGWKHFGLKYPFERHEPLVELKEGRRDSNGRWPVEIGLKPYFPTSDEARTKSVVTYLEEYQHAHASPVQAEVCFVDLASRTAGDDWGFVHRLLSSLQEPAEDEPRHLVILDAVEGFETLVGDLNAFGDKSSRRARIAQVMRLVAGRCHLLLVVEEARDQRFPEEFVTDVVIQLRNVETGRYLRRTVEIEKARGQAHKRGQHPYVIRDGRGSKTGSQENADDPKVFRADGEPQGYVHVFHSLDYHSREAMTGEDNPLSTPDKPRFAGFGLPYLDNMLGGKGEKASRDAAEGFDTRGLPCSSVTALIGDSLTQKSLLGKAFLSRAFYTFGEDLRQAINRDSEAEFANQIVEAFENGVAEVARNNSRPEDLTQKTIEAISKRVDELCEDLYKANSYPVAVLFTSQDLNPDGLTEEFYQWLRDEVPNGKNDSQIARMSLSDFASEMTSKIKRFASFYEKHVMTRGQSEADFRSGEKYKESRDAFKLYAIRQVALQRIEHLVRDHIRQHTICRQLEIHDLPGPVLMNIFQRCIEKAQRIMFFGPTDPCERELPKPAARFRDSWRIRVVVDDLNSFRNTYGEMRDDPLMLPSLLFMLGREGVTSLIIDTQASGSPDLSITERFDSSVRQLVQTRIYIWRLPFYGENRVAISVIPPMSHEYRGLIRELRWETKGESKSDRALTVDPHFELYSGLERGEPQPVPLEVRLFSDAPSVERYIATEEKLLREIFTPVQRHAQEPSVIVPAQVHEYERLRDGCHVQRDTRLDHTTIIQVNEFWWLRRPRQRRAGAFRSQWNYLSAVTTKLKDDRHQADAVVDPFGVFQPSRAERAAARTNKKRRLSHPAVRKQKLDFFDPNCGYGFERLNPEDEQQHYLDRIPYTWDFGFLLCNGKAWDEASNLQGDSVSDSEKQVADVWRELRKATENVSPLKPVSWRKFLAASKIVAEFQSYRTSAKATAFDFTMRIPESFSCLMLEMWFSEVYHSLTEYQNQRDDKSTSYVDDARQLFEHVGTRTWYSKKPSPITLLNGLKRDKGKTLTEILDQRLAGKIEGFSLELYKVWLLLTETINFEELVDNASHLDFEFKSRDVGPGAVSARHWYKTASSFIDCLTPEQVEYNWVPVRLPGHFSVRADWFLAVAGGSRSSRLADHALDLLSSKRANVTRLQEGIGLPTRKLFEKDDQYARLRTRLISATKGEALTNIEYESLRGIGAQPEEKDFFWLWRSGIWAYNRHSRIWHKWLNRSLMWWRSWRQRYGSNWRDGFEVYDRLDHLEFRKKSADAAEKREDFERWKLESWAQFGTLRDILIAELEQVSMPGA
ncbi:MAG TPA: ATPase domain-containing protein [Pyrinomonadaceae bacterium]|nr:ATPase domain-containing protein [Pyrinomonadaceae bacterium]